MPFRTISAALASIVAYRRRRQGPSQVRAINATAVYLRAGTYYLTGKPLEVTAELSHLTLTSYHGEKVVISGGQKLKIAEWKPYKHVGRRTAIKQDNIFVADLTGTSTGTYILIMFQCDVLLISLFNLCPWLILRV